MIAAAALIPGPPLLALELGSGDPEARRLHTASVLAVASLVGAGPDAIVVVGVASQTATWPVDARPDLRTFGAATAMAGPTAPLSVGLGAMLLDEVGFSGPLRLETVSDSASLDDCRSLAMDLVGSVDRVGLLVVADGSARRTLKAPGYLDERAGPYDAAVTQAITAGELAGLHELDSVLAGELLASGWPALQVLAYAWGEVRPQATVHLDEAPHGVGYLVASLSAPTA